MRANWANPDKQVCNHQGRYDGCLECAKEDKDYTIDDLESIILDIIKPDWSFKDIMYFCDLSLERAEEIHKLYQKINKNYKIRHGIENEE